MTADAVSLVREQVEKVYVISLIVDNQRRWTKQYFRNQWRWRYEHFLHIQRDDGGKPRFQEFLVEHPKRLEKGRVIPRTFGGKREVLVSKQMMRCIKYRFDNASRQNLRHPRYYSRQKLDNYFS